MTERIPARLLRALPPEEAGCEHLAHQGTDELRKLLQRYVAALRYGRQIQDGRVRPQDATEPDEAGSAGGTDDDKRTLTYPTCVTCHLDLRRPFICLECACTACLFHDPVVEPSSGRGADGASDGAEVGSSHIGLHLAEEAHAFACDMVHGTLFCSECDDVVYDPRFETLRRMEQRRTRVIRGDEARCDELMHNDAMDAHGKRLLSVCRTPRGLRNMGATCFLNVILQSFLHNPLLRNFFLSDRHNSALCGASGQCLACEMDKLFAEFYAPSRDRGPHGPTSFLYAMWMDSSSAELSQTGQHDAQEMLISALNGIHASLTSNALTRTRLPRFPLEDDDANNQLFHHSDRAAVSNGTRITDHGASCPCVVHRTFCGLLQSTITCQRCGRTTCSREPFLDLSLDVRADSAQERAEPPGDDAPGGKRKKLKKDEKHRKPPRANESSADNAQQSLLSCLRRFCTPEQLSESMYRCSYCERGARAVKQLALLRLPPVLCFQLKRYEHAAGASKLESRVLFPLAIDVRSCCVGAEPSDENAESHIRDPDTYVYELFTVVVHDGSMSSGHYTNYSRWRQHWYRFDDDKITQVPLSQVMAAKAYQLFYVRRELHNQPSHGTQAHATASGRVA